MAKIDQQLVQRIAEQVIAQLNGGGAPRPRNVRTPTPIKAPIGVCTGDYSQFTDRPDLVRGRQAKGGPTSSADGGGSAKPQAAAGDIAALTGFVTGRQVDAIQGSTLPLAFGAKLTPLARDRAKERGLTIRRVSATGAAGGKTPSTTWHWWIAGHCPAVEQLTGDMKQRLSPISAKRELSQLHRVAAELAKKVKAGASAGGVVFVPTAAQAICYANRCPSLRASVATCGQAVEQAIGQLAANVLVVEYPHHGGPAMRAMVERFITADRPSLPRVESQLKELTTCV